MSETTQTQDEAQNIVDDVTDLPMVEKAHVNDNGSIYVGFNVDSVPESFTEEMLSHGYVSTKVSKSVGSVTIGIVFKNAIGF
jgi:uncharacterized protein with ATP-grasp and redox domains